MANGDAGRLTVEQAETCTDDCAKAVSGRDVGDVDRSDTELEDVGVSDDARLKLFRDHLANDKAKGVQRFGFTIKLQDLMSLDTDSALSDSDEALIDNAEAKG